MKRFLQLSLFSGLVLIVLFEWNTSRRSFKEDQPNPPETRVVQPLMVQRPKPVPASGTNEPPEPLWASIDSEDLTKLLANLREIGCPEQTIRDLVTFRVCREYRNRLLEIETRLLVPLGYTKSLDWASHQERRWKERALRVAMDNELETVLGVSAAKLKASLLGWPHPDEGFLPLEKQRQVRDLTERYQRLIEEARQGLISWDSDPKIDARVKELEQQKEAELAQLLTPHELEESHLRSSPAARYVLDHLPEAGSEEEFRKMVRVVDELGMENPKAGGNRYGLPLFGSVNSDTGEEERELTEKNAQLDTRLKEILGEERFAEMKRSEQNGQPEGQMKEH
jgi:hypothetical protein